MLRRLLFAVAILPCWSVIAQTTLYSGNFEPPFVDWTMTGTTSPNSFIKNTCAGNGGSQTGSYSLYITDGTAGCLPGQNYSYSNAPSGSQSVIAYTTIDATCATGLQAVFDYRIQGVASQDYAELIYSTNGGGSWTVVGTQFAISANWTTTTINLPAGLNSSSFLLGVRFTYNSATITGVPLAIDNFRVIGVDNINPVITCPTSASLAVNSSCQAIALDYTKSMITLSDNCTDSINILVTQNIAIGNTIPVAPGGSTTIILTAHDEAGNVSSCSFPLQIIDDTDPVITTCPGTQVVYVNTSCVGVIGNYTSLVAASDNCSTTLTYVQSPAAGTTVNGQGITTPITVTVTDASGNASVCTFDALNMDTLVPTITCPPNQIRYANAACTSTLLDYTSLATVADNCVSSSALTVSQSPLPGATITSNTTVSLTVSGGIPAGTNTCQFTVNLVDTIKPNIICPTPAIRYLNSNCETAIPDYTGAIGWSDNCSALPATVTQNPLSTTLTSTNQLITITATDQAGNSKTCSFTMVVQDTISPQLTCPGAQSVSFNSSCSATLPNYTALVTDVENCFFVDDVVITQSPAPGTALNGPVTVIMTGLDESGNDGTCSFTVTPVDNTAPAITCPANSMVNVNSGCNYIMPNVTGSAVVSDNCTSVSTLASSVTQSPAVGTSLALGSHVITLSVNDAAGNPNTCTYTLNVMDMTAPSALCPTAQNVSVNASCIGTLGNYTGLVSATDNCTSASSLVISQSPAPGSTISSNTQITMTVTDAAGNPGTCNFFAVIVDNTDPVITVCPTTYDIAINSSCQYTIPDLSGELTVSDNCTSLANLTYVQNPAAGTTDVGLTPVSVTVFDQAGNTATCLIMLTPIDTEPPTIVSCPSPAPINNGNNCDYTLGAYSGQTLVLDNCSNFSIAQTPAAGTVLQPGTTTIQMEVTDVGGNIATCSFDLTITENVIPTITCPSNISTCNPVVTYTDPTYNDNCAAVMTQTDLTGLNSGDNFPIGISILTYTVTDGSNNSASCSFQVEVLEYPAPAVIVADTISLCETTSTVVEAVAPSSGTGVWSLVSGQATFNNQFANMTGVNNLLYGTSVLAWTVNTASCGFTSDTVVVIVSHQPLPASTQDTIYACNSASVDLLANVPLYGIGTWTTSPGADIADIHDASTTASALSQGWNTFAWTITNGSCPATSDTLRVFAVVDPVIAQQDTAVCLEQGTLSITATEAAVGQSVQWYFIQGSGQVSDLNSSTVTFNDWSLGQNIIVYEMEHDICPTVSDTLVVVASLCDGFAPVIPNMITPNFDGKNDLFVIDFLEKIYPECKVTIFNRWGSIVFESIGYEKPWDGTYNGEDLPMGTYFYKIELNDGSSTVYNGSVSIIH